jgi:CHAT domain-containing protein
VKRAPGLLLIALTLAFAPGPAAADVSGPARETLRAAERWAAAGLLDKAESALADVAAELRATGSARDRARYWGILGEVRRHAGKLAEAEGAYTRARDIAADTGDTYLQAAAENGLALTLNARAGRAAATGADTGAEAQVARRLFERAAERAQPGGHATLAASAWINAARLAYASGDPDAGARRLDRADAALGGSRDSRAAAYALTALGELAGRHGSARAPTALDRARAMAERLGDPRARAHALGAQARLAELDGDLPRARTLSARALLAAAALDAPEIDYRLHWQQGRLARAGGRLEVAIARYAAAIDRLGQVRGAFLAGFTGGRSPFRSAVEPLFREYVDLLIDTAAAAEAPARPGLLAQARAAVETLKRAELRDYFGDDCLAALTEKRTPIDRLAARAALLYPVILEARTVVIAQLQSGLTWYEVPVGRAEMTRTVRRYRFLLEKRTTREHLREGRQLYDWLIRPVAERLRDQGVKTLVVTPDGPLRTIPFAALHDGRGYLAERYAVAVTSGLDLLDARPIAGVELRPLLLGLSVPRQGFAPLPAVARELDAVQARLGGEVLLNDAFDAEALRRRLSQRPYTVVHIASHGQFEATAEGSFLLTHDGRLTLDALETAIKYSRFRDEPIELLTLSACQTAAGDDRAALGLAGVAVKSGARSALASLWSVNDEAASLLVERFYAALATGRQGRAEALRSAQRALLADPRTDHPGYWAAFLMIGNWL